MQAAGSAGQSQAGTSIGRMSGRTETLRYREFSHDDHNPDSKAGYKAKAGQIVSVSATETAQQLL